jgi:hypothetical protein
MELVTLAHATLNRIGSASTPGMVNHKEMHRVSEVPNGNPETLRELVMTIAEEHGEPRENLRAMWQENAWSYAQQRYAQQRHIVVFNIQGRNAYYSTPYAICYAHPALKIGERYFKLDEVEC